MIGIPLLLPFRCIHSHHIRYNAGLSYACLYTLDLSISTTHFYCSPKKNLSWITYRFNHTRLNHFHFDWYLNCLFDTVVEMCQLTEYHIFFYLLFVHGERALMNCWDNAKRKLFECIRNGLGFRNSIITAHGNNFALVTKIYFWYFLFHHFRFS